MSRPDPYTEIRLLSLRSLRGANLWSRRPVTRIDLHPGAYDDISSAHVAGFTESLVAAIPGLWEHRCSIGERGGFVTRLRRGTYAPHIVEHVGLELQSMAGHDVGFGRARGGDRPGEYTVVFEHLHAEVGMRAAALALELVQRGFAGELDRAAVDFALAELSSLAGNPDVPALDQAVLCGIAGGGDRAGARDEMVRRGLGQRELVVDLAPSYLLNAGLPYSRSRIAVVLDAEVGDVPERYREPELARRLVSVPADAVEREGVLVCPAREWEIQAIARDAGCRVAVFSTGDDVTERDARVAHAVAFVRGGRIVMELAGSTEDGGELDGQASPAAQVAAALAVRSLRELDTDTEADGAAAEQRNG
jgi:cyanophycin synthetase